MSVAPIERDAGRTRVVNERFAGQVIADQDYRNTTFVQCDFGGATLVRWQLEGANFIDCNFDGTAFVETDFGFTKFEWKSVPLGDAPLWEKVLLRGDLSDSLKPTKISEGTQHRKGRLA